MDLSQNPDTSVIITDRQSIVLLIHDLLLSHLNVSYIWDAIIDVLLLALELYSWVVGCCVIYQNKGLPNKWSPKFYT